jgi:hypothetical protein
LTNCDISYLEGSDPGPEFAAQFVYCNGIDVTMWRLFLPFHFLSNAAGEKPVPVIFFSPVLRIRDPVLFYPLDPGSRSGMNFFPDPG